MVVSIGWWWVHRAMSRGHIVNPWAQQSGCFIAHGCHIVNFYIGSGFPVSVKQLRMCTLPSGRTKILWLFCVANLLFKLSQSQQLLLLVTASSHSPSSIQPFVIQGKLGDCKCSTNKRQKEGMRGEWGEGLKSIPGSSPIGPCLIIEGGKGEKCIIFLFDKLNSQKIWLC